MFNLCTLAYSVSAFLNLCLSPFFNIVILLQWDDKRKEPFQNSWKKATFFFSLHILKLQEKTETWCETNVSFILIFYVRKSNTWVGNEEGIGGNHIFHQPPLRYLDRNTDIQFSKHNFEVKEKSSCHSPLTLLAPSFNRSEQCNLFSSPHIQNPDKGNIWPSSCTKQ